MNRNIEDADYEESCGDGVLLSESANNNDSKNSTSVIFDQSKEKDKRTIISKINQERYSSQNELRRNYLKRIDKSLEAVIGRSAEPIEEIRPGACEADQEQIENKPAETNETGTSHVEKVSNPKTREGSKKRSRLNKKLTPKYLLQSQDSDNNEKIENRMKKSSRWIGDHATEILENWYASHVNHPYPTKEERDLLEKDTKLASFRVNLLLTMIYLRCIRICRKKFVHQYCDYYFDDIDYTDCLLKGLEKIISHVSLAINILLILFSKS
ncbi:MAG: hypothetical protein MHMPM18_002317 [Marteilia pararefringens]